MSSVVSLKDEKLRRDMQLVSLAASVREILYQASQDLEAPATALREELLENLDWIFEDGDHEITYRMEIADAAQLVPGMPIRFDRNAPVDPAVHERVVQRDREYLAMVEARTGVPLVAAIVR